MADIINLDIRLTRPTRRIDDRPSEGKILIFTGVRYERLGADDDTPHRSGQASPVRRAGGKGKKH